MTTPNITRILADLRADFVVRQLHVDDARALVEHIERLEFALDEARWPIQVERVRPPLPEAATCRPAVRAA